MKYLRVFVKIIDGFKPQIIFAKKLDHQCLAASYLINLIVLLKKQNH